MQLPDLETTRLQLVSLDERGVGDMFEYSSDPRFYAFLEYAPHRTLQDTAEYLSLLRHRSALDTAYYWFILLKPEGKTIGTIGLHHFDRRKGHAEIGYGIGPRFWGRGYFAEGLDAVLTYAFGELQLYRLAATTPADNAASIRALRRAGFAEEGVLRSYYLSHTGRRYDAMIFSLLKHEHDARRRARAGMSGEQRRRSEMSATIRDAAGKYCGRELEYVSQWLDSENPANKTTPWSQRFEAEFCRVIGSRYAIAHNSGTSALHSCLAAAGVGRGDEVISPALTVIMDSYAAIHLGATPVFADVDRATHNIDPKDVRRKITPRTKAIITVSLQGLPADMDPIMALAREYGLIVVEDCAQTMLGRYHGRYSGTIGHLGAFSFETKKHLSTGEGGMVVSDDRRLAERVRKFGGIGYKNMTAEAGRMTILPEQFQDPDYERFDTVGLNYRMPEICAAVGLAQLERVTEIVGRRQQVARMFAQAVDGCSWIVPQRVPDGFEHTYYTYAVEYHGEAARGVSWRQFWVRYKTLGGDGFYGACKVPYLEPAYRGLTINGHGYEPGLCPMAEGLQPLIMQFKTNYRDLAVARTKSEVLARLIDEMGR